MFLISSIRINLRQIQIRSGCIDCTLQTIRKQLFYIRRLKLRWQIWRWFKHKRSLSQIYHCWKDEGCRKSTFLTYLRLFLEKMSKSSQRSLESQEETFSDGRKMDVNVNKVEADQLMHRWKTLYFRKLSLIIFKLKRKLENML